MPGDKPPTLNCFLKAEASKTRSWKSILPFFGTAFNENVATSPFPVHFPRSYVKVSHSLLIGSNSYGSDVEQSCPPPDGHPGEWDRWWRLGVVVDNMTRWSTTTTYLWSWSNTWWVDPIWLSIHCLSRVFIHLALILIRLRVCIRIHI